MFNLLCLAAAVCALAAIAADWEERRHPSFYLLKPLTTLLITGIALLGAPDDYRTLVVVALLLSCAGDICLMFKGDSWFIGGLGSFLVAHLVFVAAYVVRMPEVDGVRTFNLPWWSAVYAVYGLGFFGWLLPKTGKLMLPVIVYGIALMSMAVVASALWVQRQDSAALLALVGASVFVISDSSLAVRQFSGSYRGAQALILSTYWLAVGLIAASAVL